MIDIKENNDPYPSLPRIDWAFETYAVIDLKKELMSFEVEWVRVM